MQSILHQLSCKTQVKNNKLILQSEGWQLSGDALHVLVNRSSQFATAIFLNSWDLNKDLYISLEGPFVSKAYLDMTISFLRHMGMQILGQGREYYIPKGQTIKKQYYEVEPDMSCLFALSAMTLKGGSAVFSNWPLKSLQPDIVFPDILRQIGFQVLSSSGKLSQTLDKGGGFKIFTSNKSKVEHENSNKIKLKVMAGKALKPLKYNLKNTPDLFPVLSALLALAKGESTLYGAPHLAFKESNRLQSVITLLKQVGRKTQLLPAKDGITLQGQALLLKEKSAPLSPLCFDPKEDHRMVMAALVLKKAGFSLKILNPQVVNKSFPDFWSIVNLTN